MNHPQSEKPWRAPLCVKGKYFLAPLGMFIIIFLVKKKNSIHRVPCNTPVLSLNIYNSIDNCTMYWINKIINNKFLLSTYTHLFRSILPQMARECLSWVPLQGQYPEMHTNIPETLNTAWIIELFPITSLKLVENGKTTCKFEKQNQNHLQLYKNSPQQGTNIYVP